MQVERVQVERERALTGNWFGVRLSYRVIGAAVLVLLPGACTTQSDVGSRHTSTPGPVARKRPLPPARVPQPGVSSPGPARPSSKATTRRPSARRSSTRPTARTRADEVVAWLKAARTAPQQRTLILQVRKMRDPQTVDAVLSHLRTTPSVVQRQLAARILGAAGAGWAMQSLRRQLAHPDRKVKRAARASLARLCPRTTHRTRFELLFDATKDHLPKSLRAGKTLLLHLATSLPGRSDSVFGWPACSRGKRRYKKRGPKGRLVQYQLRPLIKLTVTGAKRTLVVSLLYLQLPQRVMRGYARAEATFKVRLTPRILAKLLPALTASLKRDLYQHLDKRAANRHR